MVLVNYTFNPVKRLAMSEDELKLRAIAKIGDIVRLYGEDWENTVVLVEFNEFALQDGGICYGLSDGSYINECDIIEVNRLKRIN